MASKASSRRIAFSSTGRHLMVIVCALASVLSTGTAGYMLIEGWSFSRALFFTVITVSTVGYGDYGLSPAGEWFSVLVIAGGIGIVTYAVTQVFPAFFDIERMQERRMYKQIMKLSDHHIVCGLGRIGRTVCRKLAEGETPFVAIDPSEEAVRWATAEGYLALLGDATEDDVLEEVNIGAARGLTSVAKEDADNIVITLSAHHLNPDLFIVARAEHEDAARKLEQAGASIVIAPTQSSGEAIANALLHPELAALSQVGSGPSHYRLIEIAVSGDCALNGLSPAEFAARYPSVLLAAVRPPHGTPRLNPDSAMRLGPGCSIMVVGCEHHIADLYRSAFAARAAA